MTSAEKTVGLNTASAAEAERLQPSLDVVVRMLRRSGWLFLLVVVVVGVLAVVQYYRGARSYWTQQSFYILVSPVGAASTYDNYQAGVWEETIGHALAEGRLTTVTGTFASAINAELAKDTSSNSPEHLTPTQLQHDLSWSNSGNLVVLTDHWTSSQGSVVLLRATAAAVEDGDFTHLTIWRGGLPPGLAVRMIPASAASAPALDQSQRSAARQLLLQRIALGTLGGLLLMLVWEWACRLGQRPASSKI